MSLRTFRHGPNGRVWYLTISRRITLALTIRGKRT